MLVELSNLTRLYGTVIGVNDITLSLAPGAYGLLGPNGAGKTTLLNLMTGQLRPTLGQIRMLGQSPRNNPAFLRQVGYLPGSEGMYSNVSAIEWVTFLTELQGQRGTSAREMAARALDEVGMTEHMHRDIAEYSRGMRQRTRLAQAIAHQPRLLILDEPFNGLDPIARHEMGAFLKNWIAEERSLILASHVLHEIEAITRQFLLLNGGRLLASGSADDIHELLADVPREVRFRTSAPRDLASALLKSDFVDSIQANGDATLVATTTSALKLYEHLVASDAGQEYGITEIRSTDGSLQELFNSLMRIHRGEM